MIFLGATFTGSVILEKTIRIHSPGPFAVKGSPRVPRFALIYYVVKYCNVSYVIYSI